MNYLYVNYFLFRSADRGLLESPLAWDDLKVPAVRSILMPYAHT